jgi:ammonia channel protein AmtB
MSSGYVQRKNEINQMVLNVVDISMFAFAYWMWGHALAYGKEPGTSPFIGVGGFFFCKFISIR